MSLTTSSMSFIALAALLSLTGCMESNEEQQARQSTLDHDTTVLQSCAVETVTRISIPTVSGQETSAICDEAAGVLGQNPSVKLLRRLSGAVWTLKHSRQDTDLIDNAHQMMQIVQARGQLTDDEAMIATFDLVYRIQTGMKGRVTLKELNIYLRSLGKKAKTITDEALLYDAAAMSVIKQDQSE